MTTHETVNRRYAELQALLRDRFHAEGRGLIEMLKSVENQLPSTLIWELRAIGHIRNKVVHDGLEDIPRYFEPMCKEATATLKRLKAEQSVKLDKAPEKASKKPKALLPRKAAKQLVEKQVVKLRKALQPVKPKKPKARQPHKTAKPLKVEQSAKLDKAPQSDKATKKRKALQSSKTVKQPKAAPKTKKALQTNLTSKRPKARPTRKATQVSHSQPEFEPTEPCFATQKRKLPLKAKSIFGRLFGRQRT